MRVPAWCPGVRLPFGVVVVATTAFLAAACSPSTTVTIAPLAAPAASVSSAQTAASAPTSPLTAAPMPSMLPALRVAWEAHGPVGDRTSTVGSAIDPLTGDIWVGIPFEDRFWIISPDGRYLGSWGSPGSGPGKLDLSDHHQNPDGWAPIAFAPDGSFYVGDTGNHRVQLFDTKRHFVRQWGTFGPGDGQFTQIISIGTDGRTVVVGDGGRYDIQAFTKDGVFLRSFGAAGQFSVVAMAADGTVRATNAENPAGDPPTLATFMADGTRAASRDLSFGHGRPESLAFDAAGNSYVGFDDSDGMHAAVGTWEIDPTGRVVRGWPDAGTPANTVTPAGDAVYISRGVQLDGTQWTVLRKYTIPKG